MYGDSKHEGPDGRHVQPERQPVVCCKRMHAKPCGGDADRWNLLDIWCDLEFNEWLHDKPFYGAR